MNVLVLGSGGREHAMIKALKNSSLVDQIHAIPGRIAWAEDCLCFKLSLLDFSAVVKYAKERKIDLVIVGPEDPLARGISDYLRSEGLSVFGPNKDAAQLEASKVFAKKFMDSAKVPTSKYEVLETVDSVLKAAENFSSPYVLKLDGLAGGKGVFICKNLVELKEAAEKVFVERIFMSSEDKSSPKVLMEEFQEGWETSVFVLTNSKDYSLLPLSQDHKRLEEGDNGPNTGGMGVICPLKIEDNLMEQIIKTVVEPSVRCLQDKKMIYNGLLYIGLMITKDGPKVIEYNVRFGDPEAQVVLPLLNGDWGKVFLDVAEGRINSLKWKSLYSACVVLAAENYPEKPVKGSEIKGKVLQETASSYFLHSGTDSKVFENKKTWITDGGRVLNAVGLGSTKEESLKNSYDLAEAVTWKGIQFRKDIGLNFKEQ